MYVAPQPCGFRLLTLSHMCVRAVCHSVLAWCAALPQSTLGDLRALTLCDVFEDDTPDPAAAAARDVVIAAGFRHLRHLHTLRLHYCAIVDALLRQAHLLEQLTILHIVEYAGVPSPETISGVLERCPQLTEVRLQWTNVWPERVGVVDAAISAFAGVVTRFPALKLSRHRGRVD